MTEETIQENLWWVIPDKLAGVRKPTAEEIPELHKMGIGAIVSVMDDPSNIDLYEEIGLPHLWSPTKGGTAPSPEQIQELQAFIQAQNTLNSLTLNVYSIEKNIQTNLNKFYLETLL